MTHPEISEELVLKSILSYLKSEIGVSSIWSNPKNLEKLFVPLVIIFDFLTDNTQKPNVIQALKT